DDGTLNRLWRIDDAQAILAVKQALAPAELLIADGHHRYETARIYADEIGGEGAHRYTLMCLVSLEDPGLTIFGTHRMLAGFDPNRLDAGIREHFDVLEVSADDVDPALEEGVGVFGFIYGERRLRLRLREPGALDAALPDRSAAY